MLRWLALWPPRWGGVERPAVLHSRVREVQRCSYRRGLEPRAPEAPSRWRTRQTSRWLRPSGPKPLACSLTSIRDFTVWLHSEGNDLSMEELIAMPEVADRLLRNYGLFLHSQGESLYFYLLTVTALQRAGPSLRTNLPFGWELAGNWRHSATRDASPPAT